MGTQGSLGYKLGRKTRLIHVDCHAELLWQIVVRELYVLLQHFGSVSALREAFEKVQIVKPKHTPTPEAIERCKPYTSAGITTPMTWRDLTTYCQHSLINVLETGYMLSNGEKWGHVCVVDFNQETVRFYRTYPTRLQEEELEHASLHEIETFEDMPVKRYEEIVQEDNARAEQFAQLIGDFDDKIAHIRKSLQNAKDIGATYEMLHTASQWLVETEAQRAKCVATYRYLYHRLDALSLICHDDEDDDV